ncbi:hypothetical protein F5144DRAFT_362378 [Chaetomium tenue]|uniref:Uncharacterized protein n=1 Tax=Chaetomium tenue TaxID=1854479 RepID=A0ACB7NYD0_9PEZI|nr:hypothetical protein F5144DRAFT_362378 [Chaetomium globosum]
MLRVTQVIVTTVEDADGWKQVGALTTTFTPPASCTRILETSSSSLAILGADFFNQDSCYPDVDDQPLIRAYFRPGRVCPSGWTGENIFGGTAGTDPRLVLPSLRPDETAVVCCPRGLRYTETLLSFAPGVGGWCLGTLTAPTSIEGQQCANCDGKPTPLPIRNANNIPMTLLQTTILLRTATDANNTPTPNLPATRSTTTSNPNITTPSTTTTTPPTETNPPTSSSTNTAAIAAGVTASILALAIIAATIFLFMRRRRRRQQQQNATSPPLDNNSLKELHSTSYAGGELLGDTNPSMVRHELGAGVGGPVELDAGGYGGEYGVDGRYGGLGQAGGGGVGGR